MFQARGYMGMLTPKGVRSCSAMPRAGMLCSAGHDRVPAGACRPPSQRSRCRAGRNNRMKPLATVEIQQQQRRGVSLARVCGEIDTSNIREIGDALGVASRQTERGLVVDLSSVTYLNSAMVKVLFELADQMQGRQQQLRLVMDDAAPMRTLIAMLKFDLVVPVHTSVEDALTDMDVRQASGGDNGGARAGNAGGDG